MDWSNVSIGQWVKFYCKEMNAFKKGFVLSLQEANGMVNIIIPENGKCYSKPPSSIHDCNSISLEQEDLDAMVDIALDVRDFHWLQQLQLMKKEYETFK
ncbi:hypothetical protein [Alkalihalobacillus sp. LMS39]|uniref:hypothetical protein n=1 Tax=Alkalihalobacillus sp. LMS39 TaxID=2924032 RepID=UPI001FB4ACF8|nr:hypothetical protein [Alkalihalobacillus sp. LMS39]UOE92055.1 hypothetical protein MM271_12330 [Alkalihalobacillus sp. LMS39]